MTDAEGQCGRFIGGKYRIDRMLGRGGMGSVYAAENVLTGKRVAIKCMCSELTTSRDAATRFMREAKASSRIRHPNVVDVYDVIEEDDSLFLIMELLEGRSLSDFLAKETVPLPRLIRLLIPAMRGVAAAHRQGVVHRDVKPENIFLAREGDDPQWVPKVLDFGISKLQGTEEIAITAPGSALGTLLYMAIEQLDGVTDVDGRADVYAFGVILYQAITGRFPFFAETVPALVLQILTVEPTPVKELRHDVPAKLGELVARAMAKQRSERLKSMEALIQELEPFGDEAKYGQWLTRTSSKPVIERVWSPAEAVTAVEPTTATPFVTSLATERLDRKAWRGPAAAVSGVLGVAGLGFLLFQVLTARSASTTTRVQSATSAPRTTQDSEMLDTQPGKLTPPSSEAVFDALQHKAAAAPESGASHAAPAHDGRANVEVAPKPAPPVAPAIPRAPAHPAAAPPPKRPNCNPNFYLDAQGDKHFKRECF